MKWIKLHTIPSLTGSIRFDLTPAERGVWYDLLLLAGLSRKPGHLQASEDKPYPLKYIASQLRIPIPLLQSTLNKCKAEGRISEDSQGLHITNWSVYQSDYARQRVYRQKKQQEPY